MLQIERIYQEMLVALRGFSGMQLGLQLAMLVAAQRRMRTMPRVLAGAEVVHFQSPVLALLTPEVF